MQPVTIVLSVVLTLLSWESAVAKPEVLRCSIHQKKSITHADLSGLATVSQTDAERAARKSLKTSAVATVIEGELEIEHGCLVYSFDIRVSGRSGIEEVLIDAGTAKVLSHMHESAKQEAVEKAHEGKTP